MFFDRGAKYGRGAAALVVLFVFMYAACSVSYAQPAGEDAWTDRWALQFQITNNFTLGDFQGSVISAKRQFSERRAFRFGAAVSSSFRNRTDEGIAGEQSRDRNTHFIRLNAQFVRYPVTERALKMYWGVGPTARFGRSKQEPGSGGTETRQWTVAGGAEGRLGVEWFVQSQISLTAEYGAGLEYERHVQTTDLEGDREQKLTETRFALGARPVRFGVSVYF